MKHRYVLVTMIAHTRYFTEWIRRGENSMTDVEASVSNGLLTAPAMKWVRVVSASDSWVCLGDF